MRVEGRSSRSANWKKRLSEETSRPVVRGFAFGGGLELAMEHLVDAVVSLEGERYAALRLVRASKNRGSATSTPNSSFARATMRVASSEWPPSSKKWSWALTSARPSSSHQTAARASSASVRGATRGPPPLSARISARLNRRSAPRPRL